MDFNKTVCENFFDFSRELNQSDDIIQAIYTLIQRVRNKNEGQFAGIEKRLVRSSHLCRDAESFITLAKTCFRNNQIRNNEIDKYLALLFFTGEWINDQARLFVPDGKMGLVTDQIILSMSIILYNQLNFKMRSDWYEFVSREIKLAKLEEQKSESFAVPFLMGLSLAAIFSLRK